MDFDTSRPVWVQLVEEFTRKIASGEWIAGQKVPSTRDLALDYRVNPNTVQKALAEIDRRGHTKSERTSGRIVLVTDDATDDLKTSESEAIADRALEQLTGLGLSPQDIETLFRERLLNHSRKGEKP